MNQLRTLLLVTALAASPLAVAHGMGDHCDRMGHGPYAGEADKNKDGAIDKAEFQAMHDRNFDEMDTNHDGKLSKEEWAACMRKGKRGAMHDKGTMGFNKADKDSSGTLTKEEAKGLPRVSQNFDAIDVDKDGTVDRDEVHNFMMDHPAP